MSLAALIVSVTVRWSVVSKSLRVPVPLQYLPKPLRRDRELRNGAGHAERVIDSRGNSAPTAFGATFAGALEPERVCGARRVLGDEHSDRRHLARPSA